MNERGKPFPQIPRFPGEARLEGVPHAAKESLLLNNRNLVDTLEIIANTRRMNSDTRSAYIKRLSESLNGNGGRAALIETSLALAKGELTESETLKNDSRYLLERLEPGISRKIRSPFKDEAMAALDESETISSHLDYFAEYLRADEENRSSIAAEHAREFLKDPKKILDYAQANAFIEEAFEPEAPESDEEGTYYDYCEELDESLEILAGKSETSKLDEGTLIHWMRLLNNSDYEPIAEKVLANWLNNHDVETVMDRLHLLATIAFTSKDEDVQGKMVDIVGLKTGVMPIDSLAAIRYAAAGSQISIKSWQQRREIDDAEKLIFMGRALGNRIEHIKQAKSEAFREYMGGVGKKIRLTSGEGELARREAEMFKDILRGRRRITPRKNIEEFDDDPVMTDSKLRHWLTEGTARKYMTRKLPRDRKILGEIQLPGLSRHIKAPLPEVVSHVSDALSQLPAQELAKPENWRTLALVVPQDLDQKRLDGLNAANEEMCKEIRESRLRGVSRRGDRIFITNPMLQEFGFSKIEAYPKEDGYQIKIDVKGKTFVGKLDEDLQLIDERFGSHARLPITGAFLNHVIVCHMHELLCSEFDEENIDESTNEHGRQFYSRRDHQRVLPFGERPTPGQIIKALADYKVDLNERNRARIQAGETSYVTWVSAVERIDMSGSGPVESHAVNATERLEKILG